ncbi:MAG: GGDEF domain-containing protein [Candidatus Competibacteraceae bacterium]|nr:MAG: GGDEF domain-containing protein [Candidatus Competibacteraceae bacterium]
MATGENSTDPVHHAPPSGKPRLVPLLVLIASIAAGLGCIAAFVLVKVQYDILGLAEQASRTLLPQIQTEVRTIINLERLKVFGEIVRGSPLPRERREALLAARILSMDATYEQNLDLKKQVEQVIALIERMSAYRNAQDSARQHLDGELSRLYRAPDDPGSGTPSPSTSDAQALIELAQELHLLQSGLSQVPVDQDRLQLLDHFARKLADYAACIENAETRVGIGRIEGLLRTQRGILDADINLNRDWRQASNILENLAQQRSVSAAVSAAEGNTIIAARARQAMVLVTATLGGLILLFVAALYFFQRAIVKPILRVTAGLERARLSHGTVHLRRERIRELDNIARAAEEFGAALAQISERSTALEREVYERQQAQAQLQELATTDSLTGLRNRRYFMYRAAEEFERARRYRLPLALLMLDADHFKAINDRYGHPIGDQVLQALARRGQELLRDVDLFARIGGEEFAILLPQTDLAAARVVAERLRQRMASTPIVTDQGPLILTISLGLTGFDATVIDFDALLRRADAALYRAKQNGRNCTEVLPEPS